MRCRATLEHPGRREHARSSPRRLERLSRSRGYRWALRNWNCADGASGLLQDSELMESTHPVLAVPGTDDLAVLKLMNVDGECGPKLEENLLSALRATRLAWRRRDVDPLRGKDSVEQRG